MTGKRLVIFDCDGTLVDSENIHHQILSSVFQDFGFMDITPLYVRDHYMGRTITDISNEIYATRGVFLPPEFSSLYVQRVHEQQALSIRPVTGAVAVVTALSTLPEFVLCIGSNGARENVVQSLALCGLGDFFPESRIFTKIQVPRPKPFPDLFLYAAAQCGFKPADCIVIEDSVPGVRAGVAAGMATLGFAGSAHDPQKAAQNLADAGAFAAAMTMDRVLEFILSWEKGLKTSASQSA